MTMLVTCMADPKEGVPELRKWCKLNGVKHWHIQLEDANQDTLNPTEVNAAVVRSSCLKLFQYLL